MIETVESEVSHGMYKGHTRNVKGIAKQLLRGQKPAFHAVRNVALANIIAKDKHLGKDDKKNRISPPPIERKRPKSKK